MALENHPLNGKIHEKCPLFWSSSLIMWCYCFPSLQKSHHVRERVATFHIFGIVGHCQTLPPLYHAFISPNGTPPSLSWDLNFGCRQQKGNIAIHKIRRIPNRANLHLIILKREPRAYAGPTVSTFFQYRRSPPIIISSKLDFFCYKRFCPKRDP